MSTMKSKQKFFGGFSVRKFLVALFWVITVVLLAWVAISAAVSGYHYQFDTDEFHYAQFIYLYANGLRPYLDVYSSVHPAIFQWLMIPVFLIKGFTTIETLYTGRAVMIILLAIRLVCAWYIIRIIFSKRTAVLFLFMFLFDPFAVFTSMQIRPDNLMLTVYTAGLLAFSLALTGNKKLLPVARTSLGGYDYHPS